MQHGYVEIAVVLAVHLGRRPVLYAHHLEIEKNNPVITDRHRRYRGGGAQQRRYYRFAHLDEVERLGQHDDATRVFLPYHSPKIVDRVLGGPLGDNVGVRFEQTLKIDVHTTLPQGGRTTVRQCRAAPRGVFTTLTPVVRSWVVSLFFRNFPNFSISSVELMFNTRFETNSQWRS